MKLYEILQKLIANPKEAKNYKELREFYSFYDKKNEVDALDFLIEQKYDSSDNPPDSKE